MEYVLWINKLIVTIIVCMMPHRSITNAQSLNETEEHYSGESHYEHEHEHLHEPKSTDTLAIKGEISQLFAVDQEILQITRQQQKIRSRLAEFKSKRSRFAREISDLSISLKKDRITLVKLLAMREQVKSTRIVELLLSADGPLEQKRREVYIQAIFRSGSQRFKTLLRSKRDLTQRQRAVETLNQKEMALQGLLDEQAIRLNERRKAEWEAISKFRHNQHSLVNEEQVSDLLKEKWENTARLPPSQGRWIDEYRKFRGLSLAKMYGGGIWILSKHGAPIYTVEEGQILFANRIRGWGKVVIIEHLFGYMSIYANLSNLEIKEGQQVAMQAQIGSVGSAAGREGLYFELRRGGEPIHPNRWIMNEQTIDQQTLIP